MKRKIKDGTGLCAHLNSIGVLNTGTDNEIAEQKRIYWAKYRKEWKKNKRQQSKRYILLVSFKEAKAIDKKAEKFRITPVKFIKHAALAQEHLVGPVVIGEVREKLMMHTQSIESMMTEPRIPGPIKARILTSAYHIEKTVLSLLTPK